MLAVKPMFENTEQAMTLTDDYLDLNEADVYVYFTSGFFGADSYSKPEPFSGWHGQTLAHWIREKAKIRGYQLSEPTDQLTSWTMELALKNSTWNVVCENLKYNSTDRWKVTITSHSLPPNQNIDSARQLCSEFCFFCRDILLSSNDIERVEWNIAELNTTDISSDKLVY